MNKLESALSPLVKIGLKSVLIFGVPTKANKVSKHDENWLYFVGYKPDVHMHTHTSAIEHYVTLYHVNFMLTIHPIIV